MHQTRDITAVLTASSDYHRCFTRQRLRRWVLSSSAASFPTSAMILSEVKLSCDICRSHNFVVESSSHGACGVFSTSELCPTIQSVVPAIETIVTTVGPGYNDIGLCDIWPIESYILWY